MYIMQPNCTVRHDQLDDAEVDELVVLIHCDTV
jgi:hypothetical protein